MDEHAVLVLLGMAAIGATFAGFSGIVTVFRRPGHEGQWSPEDRFRLGNLLIPSLGVCFMPFLPLTLEQFQLGDRATWLISSLVLGTLAATDFVWTLWRLFRLRHHRAVAFSVWGAWSYAICGALAPLVQLAVLTRNGSGPFAAGLAFLLVGAGLQFGLLVFRPHVRPATPRDGEPTHDAVQAGARN
jgi:hypothetical protein